jgi:hypothetical protein
MGGIFWYKVSGLIPSNEWDTFMNRFYLTMRFYVTGKHRFKRSDFNELLHTNGWLYRGKFPNDRGYHRHDRAELQMHFTCIFTFKFSKD